MMNVVRFICLFVLLLSAAPVIAADKQESLLIEGDNFTVSVEEPAGWTADSAAPASERVNLVLQRNTRDARGSRPSIRILIANKMDEMTEEDLNYDMESYRKKFPGVRFKDVPVKHPEYRTFPRLFYVENGFYEYVTYLNPGRTFRYNIIVSMSQRAEAGSDDLQAYAALVASIKAVK